MQTIPQNFLDESIATFRSYKKSAEQALAQISDEEFFRKIDSESNSAALIVKHLGGNLRSRWTSFLTTDGEKPDRNRDAEFEEISDTRASLTKSWESGWQAALDSLESLKAEDLDRIVKIRGEEFTVLRAILRSLTHTAYHVGQIIFLAKHLRGERWRTLSIPKNKSAEFNDWLNAQKDQGNYLEAGQKFSEKQ